MKANAAYFQFGIISSVVAAALKHLVLPEGWQNFTMKTLRFRVINFAGKVVRHAGQTKLRIPFGHAFRSVFEDAWFRILGLTTELAISTA